MKHFGTVRTMKSVIVLQAVIVLFIPNCGVCLDLVLPYFTDEMQPNSIIEYVFYPFKVQWSAARTVCQSIGGDLAKINSKKLMDAIVSISIENFQRDIYKADYWVGLVEYQPEGHYWVSDCSNLTYTSNYDSGTHQKCFRHKKATHNGESRSCEESNSFLCQIVTNDKCMYTGFIVSDVISVDSNMTVCKNLCNMDPKCWGTAEYVPDSCVMLALQGYGVQNFTMSYKGCVNVTENTTDITNPDNVNNLPIPYATCGYILPTPSYVAVASSIGLPSCEPVNVTSYVTTTVNVPLTKTITVLSTLFQNISNEEAQEVAEEIVKNLTIDSKSTSSHLRKLSSAKDTRKSATFVGYVGVLFVVVPLGILFLADIKNLTRQTRRMAVYLFLGDICKDIVNNLNSIFVLSNAEVTRK